MTRHEFHHTGVMELEIAIFRSLYSIRLQCFAVVSNWLCCVQIKPGDMKRVNHVASAHNSIRQ
jgi:hypothetical protein